MSTSARRRRLAIRLAAAVGLALALWHLWIFGEVWWLRGHDPRTTAFMEEGLERMRARDPHARLQHQWMPYARIADHLKAAVVAAEGWPQPWPPGAWPWRSGRPSSRSRAP